jgi:RND superfamily putative drug exporter
MVAVFAVFVATGTPTIRQIGLGNAVAIGLDATLVRLVLVPAAMVLLGRWNWWLPPPLAGLGGAQAAEPTR